MIGKREFEEAYARRSNITVTQLREMNRRVYPCDCGEHMCDGWQSVNAFNYWDDRLMREPRFWNRLWIWIVWKVWKLREGR